ncbi:four helix bundle protein [Saccharicrinis sp. FJH62]|uniref:four helix bundle protein n=1 Tax=Saccharicrinis sp. FJH62 TaxID=3344657 RepID=UPI0035D43C04
MNSVKQFEDLAIWKDARILVNEVYKAFYNLKDFSFKDQIQRASVSVLSNVAEGFERNSTKDFMRFLYIAKASCGEVRSMTYIGVDLNYLDKENSEAIQNKCRKLSISIYNLIKYLAPKHKS